VGERVEGAGMEVRPTRRARLLSCGPASDVGRAALVNDTAINDTWRRPPGEIAERFTIHARARRVLPRTLINRARAVGNGASSKHPTS